MKIGSRPARFKRLAETQNICVVYENEPSIKKLIVRTKISVENKNYMCLYFFLTNKLFILITEKIYTTFISTLLNFDFFDVAVTTTTTTTCRVKKRRKIKIEESFFILVS